MAVSLFASGSHDEHFAIRPTDELLTVAEPDPILGKFVTPDSDKSVRAASTKLPEPGPAAKPVPDAAFPAIKLDAPPARPSRLKAALSEDTRRPDDDDVEYDDRRTLWTTVLLASYASAITMAFAWTLMKERPRDNSAAPGDAPVAQPEPARQASLSKKVEPPEPILGEHFAKLGEPLRVGSLEITPIEVRRENVSLQRANTFNNTDRRDGGKKALVLRLKLRNTSADSVFAPLDQAYLRERGKEVVDTFVETAKGEKVYPYPLAVDSEWSIVGQDFTELRPSESRTVAIVSAPDAPPDSDGPFTWRVRLRTGIDRTDAIGFRTSGKSIQPNKGN